MKMPKNVDLSKSINREKVIEPSIANNEKNIECPPLAARHIRRWNDGSMPVGRSILSVGFSADILSGY
jgi:hypothetical protein